MQQSVATAVLERTADMIVTFATCAGQRQMTTNEWAAYDAALSLFQMNATALEITIDQQVIAPSIQASQPEDREDGKEGNSNPE